MAVKIKLKRMGKIRAPYYRIVVADARTKRDGRAIEEIGIYHPKEDPSRIEVKSDRAQYWLGVGAQPTDPVIAIFKVSGDWQTFRGEPAPPPMLMKEPKRSRADVYHEAVALAHADDAGDAKAGGRAATTRRPKLEAPEGASSAPAAAEVEQPAAEASTEVETESPESTESTESPESTEA